MGFDGALLARAEIFLPFVFFSFSCFLTDSAIGSGIWNLNSRCYYSI